MQLLSGCDKLEKGATFKDQNESAVLDSPPVDLKFISCVRVAIVSRFSHKKFSIFKFAIPDVIQKFHPL